jgi:hypothetical protein
MTTNAFSSKVGVLLSYLIDSTGGSPRFVRFSTRLSGEVSKGVRRGNHVVENVVLIGVSYENMVRRSESALSTASASPTFVSDVLAALANMTDEITNLPITEADVLDAVCGTVRGRKGLLTAYRETLAQTNTDSTSAHVYRPLHVDGDIVPGCKVYTGTTEPKDDKSPVPGTVYVSGITIASKVVEASPTGDRPQGRRGAVAIVKEYLEDSLSLPAARFRTYRILPGEQYEMVCGDVAFHALEGGPVSIGPRV